MEPNDSQNSDQRADPAAPSEAVNALPPSPDASQQPGFKVVDERPRGGGSKLVWTALIAAVLIIAGYYAGYFR